MKISKVANTTARRIFRLCSVEGTLNEQKLLSAVEKIVEKKPRDYRGILHALYRLVRLDEQARKAMIESAEELDSEKRTRIEENLNKQYTSTLSFQYQINPDLLGGMRIRVGNDVWDGSVKSRLERLAETF